jgi:cell shape-determining protein MreD
VKALNFLLTVSAAVFLQAALGNLSGGFDRYIDLTLLPVIWYGIHGTQRSAMLVGCSVGLIHDAWFRIAVFGISGFKRTLLGWALGGLGGRFDLNRFAGRFTVGFLMSLSEGILDAGLRRLMDLAQGAAWSEMLIRAACTGAAAVVVFGLIDKSRDTRDRGRFR